MVGTKYVIKIYVSKIIRKDLPLVWTFFNGLA